MKPLTPEQKKILDFINDCLLRTKMPPTGREIALHFGYRSPNNARQHLRLIEKKGYLRRITGKARGIITTLSLDRIPEKSTVHAPLVGSIAAGKPVTAVENLDGHIALDRSLFKEEGLFTLRVKGDSMKDLGIFDRDIAIIHQQATVNEGEVAAVIVEGEATLKRYHRQKGHIVLQAANPDFKDITVASDKHIQVAGKLVGVIRKYR